MCDETEHPCMPDSVPPPARLTRSSSGATHGGETQWVWGPLTPPTDPLSSKMCRTSAMTLAIEKRHFPPFDSSPSHRTHSGAHGELCSMVCRWADHGRPCCMYLVRNIHTYTTLHILVQPTRARAKERNGRSRTKGGKLVTKQSEEAFRQRKEGTPPFLYSKRQTKVTVPTRLASALDSRKRTV